MRFSPSKVRLKVRQTSVCRLASYFNDKLKSVGLILQRGIADASREIPDVIERIGYSADAITIRLVRRRATRSRARRECAFVPGVHIIDVQEERRRHRLPGSVRFAHLDHRVSNLHRGVPNYAVRRLV